MNVKTNLFIAAEQSQGLTRCEIIEGSEGIALSSDHRIMCKDAPLGGDSGKPHQAEGYKAFS